MTFKTLPLALVLAATVFLSAFAETPFKPAYGDEAPSFKRDVLPVLMRDGCNAGDCHGSARGQDGFMLSLFGYDPEGDYYRIKEEYVGRRINLAEPRKSLLLEKATGAVAHTGGECFTEDSASYKVLLDWLKAGAPRDPDDAAVAESIRFEKESLRFETPSGSVAGKVIAAYTDGTERDITQWCLYMTSDESVVKIGDDGKISAHKPGGAHVFARFDRFTVGAEVTVLPEGEFDWAGPKPTNYIDELVFAKLEDLRIPASGLCTDEEFLRRVTIDLNGTLPTTEEYYAFMNSEAPDKRAKLVDDLMARPDFAAVWAARWGEWLRIYTDTNPGSGTARKAGWVYYHWLREQFEENLPLNDLAHQLLTGTGSNLRNAPANYYNMIAQGHIKPMKLGEDTAQIFLGLQTQCAQCHNHPFDRWTVDDYYAFTSFFTGVKRKHGTEAREYFTYVDIEAKPAKHIVYDTPVPHAFLGGGPADVKGKDPRAVLANWMTDGSNALFRENLANRIWSHFFGRGIVEPVDDVRISNPPSNGPLYAEIGRRFGEDYDFDQKRLIRDIVLSTTYQLSAGTVKGNERDDRFFSHAALRRMRADVLFDALGVAMEADLPFRGSTAERALVLFEGGRNDSHNAYFFKTFGQARRESVCACEDKTEATLAQALNLINGNTVQQALRRHSTLVPDLIKAHRDDPAQIVETLYVRCLSRKPSDTELKAILAEKPAPTGNGGKDGLAERGYYDGILWALVNSSEFLFNH